jgi:hypothetical protein
LKLKKTAKKFYAKKFQGFFLNSNGNEFVELTWISNADIRRTHLIKIHHLRAWSSESFSLEI